MLESLVLDILDILVVTVFVLLLLSSSSASFLSWHPLVVTNLPLLGEGRSRQTGQLQRRASRTLAVLFDRQLRAMSVQFEVSGYMLLWKFGGRCKRVGTVLLSSGTCG